MTGATEEHFFPKKVLRRDNRGSRSEFRILLATALGIRLSRACKERAAAPRDVLVKGQRPAVRVFQILSLL